MPGHKITRESGERLSSVLRHERRSEYADSSRYQPQRISSDEEFPRTSGTSQIAVFVTPSGGIAARSGSTLGSATCTRYSVSGGTRSSTSDTSTVYNDFSTAIAGSTDIIASKIDGIWVAHAEDCA